VTAPVPSPPGTWLTVDELKNDQSLDGVPLSTRDDVKLQRSLYAAMSWVMDRRKDVDYHGNWTVPWEVRLGTLRLAARWFIRSNSPTGLVQMGELGAGQIPAVDNDIYLQLGILGGLA
jgi:hypothetical protein